MCFMIFILMEPMQLILFKTRFCLLVDNRPPLMILNLGFSPLMISYFGFSFESFESSEFTGLRRPSFYETFLKFGEVYVP